METLKNKPGKELLTVKEVDSDFDSKWIDFISKHSSATVYNHPLWIKVLERESNSSAVRLVCFNEQDEVTGVMALLPTRGLPGKIGGILTSKRLSSLPRTPSSSVVAANIESENALLEKAITMVESKQPLLLQIKSESANTVHLPSSLCVIPWRKTYKKEIPSDDTEIRFGNSRNHAAVTRAVKKAKRSGLQIKEASSVDDLKKWYSLYLDTMRFHFAPARSFGFFLDLWNLLKPKGMMSLSIAELEKDGKKKLFAGSVYLMFNNTIYYAFNGSCRDSLDIRPNDLLHWEAIHQAQIDGFSYYDLGEVQKNQKGLEAYKKKWSSLEVQIYHYYYPSISILDELDSDYGERSKLVKKVWKNTPLKITELIGGKLYSYL